MRTHEPIMPEDLKHIYKRHEKGRESTMLVVGSSNVKSILPGRYAWHYRVDNMEQTFTFQTLEEMVKFAKEYNHVTV